jgi:ABC-type spermidine/putrescine transport system permease subunit II
VNGVDSPASRTERLVLAVIGLLGLTFLVAPMLIVILASLDPGPFFQFPPKAVSLHWYSELTRDSTWLESIRFTLLIALLTAVASTVIGGLAGVAAARMSPRRRQFLYPLLVAPLTVPPIAIALSMYGVALEFHLIGRLLSFVAANTLLTAPLVTLFVTAAALAMDRRLEFASLSCGAGPWRTLVRITLPSIAPTAIAGGALSFLLTLDEVVISSFLVGPGRTPLAVKLFLQVQTGTTPILTAVATLLIVASVLFVGVLIAVRSVVVASRQRSIASPIASAPDRAVPQP